MRRFVLGFAIALSLLTLGCAQSITDIDRTKDNKTLKSMFVGNQWFMLSTVIDTPAQTRHTFIGLQGSHEMVEWDIQESLLIAYRVHEHVAGSEEFAAREGTTYRGAAVAAYPIQAHFDLKRGYSAATGEQSNTLSENMSDRPWHERDYIRVDWANNTIADMTFGPDNFMVTAGGDVVHERQGCEEAGSTDCEAGALDVSDDHINITSRIIVAPISSRACFMAWGIAWEADDQTLDCEAAEVKVRTSFMRVDEKREASYNPFLYNDKHYNKFGIFRTNRFGYDRDYGVREPNRQDLAGRWHIWQESIDEDGNVIPYRQREVRPVVYYLNAEFPAETALYDGNDEVEAEWDRVFRNAVAAAQGIDASEVPQMFYICDNPVPEGAPEACGEPGTSPLLGDLRYPMIHYTDQKHISSPLGYGPSSGNPLTGRLFHATSNIYGASLSTYSQYATDMVKLLNGDLPMEDYLGDYFDNVLSGNRQSLTLHQAMDASSLQRLGAQSEFSRTREALVRSVNNGDLESDWSQPIRDSLSGTLLERKGLTDEMVHALTGGQLAANDERSTEVSPINMMGKQWDAQDKARARFRERNGCILAPEFDDAAVLKVAQRLSRDPDMRGADGALDYDKVLAKVKRDIYVGVLLHELGHTVGMAHNFASSNDAANYHDEYWDIRAASGDVEPFFSMSPEARERGMNAATPSGHGIKEYQYSSIMEYGRRWMSDIAGLGKYDNATIKYAYARTVEVWDHGRDVPVAAYDGLREKMKPHNYHYSMYPKMFAFGANMNDRDAVQRFRQRKDVPMDEVGEGEGFSYNPDQEVYYRFCDNTHDGRFAWCRPFDEGADQWEVVAAVVDDYEGYYPFYNFRRGRLGFGMSLNGYINRIYGRLADVSAQYKHFVNEQMFLRGDRDCIHPVSGQPVQAGGRNLKPWESPICGGDGHAASRLGFDLFARIIQQPDLGTYIWNNETNAYVGFDRRINERTTEAMQELPDAEEEPEYDLSRRFELYDDPARDHETRYDRERYGYGFYYKPVSIGVWWDKYMALNAMTSPGENFAYTDTRPDMLRYNVNWSLLFPGEMLNIAGAAASQTYSAYGPLYDGDKVVWRRFATASDSEKASYANMDVLSPGDSFTVRFLSIIMGAAWMPQSTMSKDFNQAFKIGIVGAQDQFDVSDEIKADPELYVEVEDPVTHRVYFAVNTGRMNGDLVNYGGAAALSPGYELLKKVRNDHLDAQGNLRADKVALEVAQNVEDAVADKIEELTAIAEASAVCQNAAESADNRRACGRLKRDARVDGEAQGRIEAEQQARHTINNQLHGAFYFPDLIRGFVYFYENR